MPDKAEIVVEMQGTVQIEAGKVILGGQWGGEVDLVQIQIFHPTFGCLAFDVVPYPNQSTGPYTVRISVLDPGCLSRALP